MESVRVRGCVGGTELASRRQADASRRRNGPRKTAGAGASSTPDQPITVRLRGKSCPVPAVRYGGPGEKAGSGRSCESLSRRLWGRRPGRPDGLRSSPGTTPPGWFACAPRDRTKHGRSSMDIVVKAGTARCRTGSAVTSRRSWPGSRSTTTAIIRVEVEVEKERNPRQHDRAVRVELTAFSKGPVIRAEAAAEDKMARPRPGGRQDGRPDAPRRRPPPRAPRPAHAGLGGRGPRRRRADARRRGTDDDGEVIERQVGPITVTGDGPLVVREKTHPASR